MSNLLRDPIWNGIAAILAITSIILTITFFFKQWKRKSLAYFIATEAPLFEQNDSVKGNLQITYAGRNVTDLYLLVLKITNDGSVPIRLSDFEKPIEFSFGESEIIQAQITAKRPKNLTPNLQVEINKLIIRPMLLNPKDTFVIQTIFTQYSGEIYPKIRIVGVRDIEMRLAEKFTKKLLPYILPTIPLVLLNSFLTLISFLMPKSNWSLLFGIVGSIGMILILVYIVDVVRRVKFISEQKYP
jgi:hypothetical protein